MEINIRNVAHTFLCYLVINVLEMGVEGLGFNFWFIEIVLLEIVLYLYLSLFKTQVKN